MAATQEEVAKPPLRSGRGGVVKQFLATPPRLRELRWLRNFSGIARPNPDGPSAAQEGSRATFEASQQFGQPVPVNSLNPVCQVVS